MDGVVGARIVNTKAQLTGNALVDGELRTTTSRQNYVDVNRTYHDATEALAHYPSLSVRTDVYSA